MNTTKSVYNRLFAEDKVELASERVELDSHKVDLNMLQAIDSIKEKVNVQKSNLDKMKTQALDVKQMIEKSNKLKEDLQKSYINNKTVLGKINAENKKAFDVIFKQAKDLGVDIKNVPAYKDYLTLNKTIDDLTEINQSNWEILSNLN